MNLRSWCFNLHSASIIVLGCMATAGCAANGSVDADSLSGILSGKGISGANVANAVPGLLSQAFGGAGGPSGSGRRTGAAAEDVAPSIPANATRREAVALRAVTHTSDGRWVSAGEAQHLFREHTFYTRPIHAEPTTAYRIWYLKGNTRYSMDNIFSTATTAEIAGDQICVDYNGHFCYRMRELPDHAYVLADGGRDSWFVTQIVPGDPERLVSEVAAYEAAHHDENERINKGLEQAEEMIREEIENQSACSAAGGYWKSGFMGGGTCWVRR